MRRASRNAAASFCLATSTCSFCTRRLACYCGMSHPLADLPLASLHRWRDRKIAPSLSDFWRHGEPARPWMAFYRKKSFCRSCSLLRNDLYAFTGMTARSRATEFTPPSLLVSGQHRGTHGDHLPSRLCSAVNRCSRAAPAQPPAGPGARPARGNRGEGKGKKAPPFRFGDRFPCVCASAC